MADLQNIVKSDKTRFMKKYLSSILKWYRNALSYTFYIVSTLWYSQEILYVSNFSVTNEQNHSQALPKGIEISWLVTVRFSFLLLKSVNIF